MITLEQLNQRGIGKLPGLTQLRCIEVAIEQIGFRFINANIEAASRLCVKSPDGRITVYRVKLIRLNIAEEALPRVLVRVIRQRQQVFAFYLALQEHRSPGRRIPISRGPSTSDVGNLLLKAILRAHWREAT